MEIKKDLNWEADTISGIFGYSTLDELLEEAPEYRDISVIFSIITHNLTKRESYLLAALIRTLTGEEIENTLDLFKYLIKLFEEDIEVLSNYFAYIVSDIE